MAESEPLLTKRTETRIQIVDRMLKWWHSTFIRYPTPKFKDSNRVLETLSTYLSILEMKINRWRIFAWKFQRFIALSPDSRSFRMTEKLREAMVFSRHFASQECDPNFQEHYRIGKKKNCEDHRSIYTV